VEDQRPHRPVEARPEEAGLEARGVEPPSREVRPRRAQVAAGDHDRRCGGLDVRPPAAVAAVAASPLGVRLVVALAAADGPPRRGGADPRHGRRQEQPLHEAQAEPVGRRPGRSRRRRQREEERGDPRQEQRQRQHGPEALAVPPPAAAASEPPAAVHQPQPVLLTAARVPTVRRPAAGEDAPRHLRQRVAGEEGRLDAAELRLGPAQGVEERARGHGRRAPVRVAYRRGDGRGGRPTEGRGGEEGARVGPAAAGSGPHFPSFGRTVRELKKLPLLAKMADDGDGAKRPKTAEGGQDGVVTAEEAELLRRRIAELESEIERLRRRGRQEGDHEVLPVVTEVNVTVSTTVDLSRVDTGLVTHITSFLGTPRELLNLALTCKSFGWRQPMSTLNWSLVEEVARQTVCSRATDDEIGCLPRYVSGMTTWLSILHRHEHLLDFDVLLGGSIDHRNGDKTAVFATGENNKNSVAVSSSYAMSSGAHYAEFLITGVPFIGIVRPMPGLDDRAYLGDFCFIGGDYSFFPDFLAQRSDDWGNSDVHACDFNCDDGRMALTAWDENANDEIDFEWEGMEGCQSGDTVGMLLNFDEGTLTVYKNNRRLGVMKDGLSGPYCWYVHLFSRETVDTVSIKRGPLPDSDGATRT
ncbi:hypothetical protein THAOC_05018, partial [Thalassiosira oceanica]